MHSIKEIYIYSYAYPEDRTFLIDNCNITDQFFFLWTDTSEGLYIYNVKVNSSVMSGYKEKQRVYRECKEMKGNTNEKMENIIEGIIAKK